MLDANIGDLRGLKELSATDYLALPKRFSDEQIFKAPVLRFLGHKWKITIGARAGYIRKIFAENAPLDRGQAEAIFSGARAYWLRQLGKPSEESFSRIIWDAEFGNVIIARRDSVPFVSLALTSRLEVHSHSDQKTARALSQMIRNSGFILRLGLSEPQLLRWLWLRAAEWANLPSFVSQPIVPILFIFFYWPFVLAGVFALDVLWTFVRYRYVNVRAASYVANFVTFTKWPAAIGSAIFLFVHHRSLAAILAIAWPLGLSGLVAVPGQIGRLQKLFAKKIGHIAERVIQGTSAVA
jgi:hypothetical protein